MPKDVTALKNIRKNYRIPRSQVSRYLGTTETSIFRWEKGKAEPSPIFRERLRTFLKVFSEELGIDPPGHIIQGPDDEAD